MLIRGLCLLATIGLVFGQPLPKLLEELVWQDPQEDANPPEFKVFVPKKKSDCSDMSVVEMKTKFIELIPEMYAENEAVVAGTDEIFRRIDYCQRQIDDEIYLNLRTAIISGVFIDKNIVLNVPRETQVKCLRSMEREQKVCNGYKQNICNYVNPLNGDAPEFSVQLVQELLIQSSALSETERNCQGMVGIIKDEEALESAAPIDHDAIAVVNNGLAVPFLQELNRAAASGYLAEVWGGFQSRRKRSFSRRS